mmetsp:Transcript_49526/g.74762  ORF Transcript_49526/g.74762 Transcript_49526/m.74762 type:complete len:239 (-) Transcript_49526:84-800(-)
MDNLLSISAACESYLAKAESSGLIAQKLASLTSSQAPPASKELSHYISHSSLPTSAADASSSALREALKAVMAERDEAHAKLIASNVLHVHEMEQKRKKIEHITKKLEMAERIADGGAGASFFLGQVEIEKTKIRRYEEELIENADADLTTMCHQLSSEIEGRTSAALEIIRLKESHKIEQESQLAERQALQNELNLYKEMLKKEQIKSKEARENALQWKRSFDEVVLVKEDQNNDNI